MADNVFKLDPQDVAKARSMGATDDDIIAHLAQVYPGQADNFRKATALGASSTDIIAHLAPKTDLGTDIGKSVISGAAHGLMSLPGMLGDVQRKLDSIATRNNWVDQNKLAQMRAGYGGTAPSTQDIEGAVGFQPHIPETTPGKIAGSAAQFASSSLPFGGMSPTAILQRLASGGTAGAASEAAGEATQGTPLETPARVLAATVAPGRLVGRLAGAEKAIPTTAQVGNAAVGNFNRAQTATTSADYLAEMAEARKNMGAYQDMQNVSREAPMSAKVMGGMADWLPSYAHASPWAIAAMFSGRPELALDAFALPLAKRVLKTGANAATRSAIQGRLDSIAQASPAGVGTGQLNDPRILRALMISQAMNGGGNP